VKSCRKEACITRNMKLVCLHLFWRRQKAGQRMPARMTKCHFKSEALQRVWVERLLLQPRPTPSTRAPGQAAGAGCAVCRAARLPERRWKVGGVLPGWENERRVRLGQTRAPGCVRCRLFCPW